MRPDASAGGGAAAARTVEAAAHVAAMVARYSDAPGLAAQAAALERRAAALARRNAMVFASALEALRGEGHRDLGTRMTGAAEVPGRIAEAAADVGVLASELARTAAPDLRPDAVAAAALAEAAAAAAAHLVAVNLTITPDDPRLEAARAAAAAARGARDAALRGWS
jgi:formiminotetrahydrofolate cyclodeaminase